MVEEKKEAIEKLRKSRHIKDQAGTWAVVIGFTVMFAGIGVLAGLAQFNNDKHLATPDIPLKDSDNATYSFTFHDWRNAADQTLILLVGGLVLVLVGTVTGYVNLGERQFHKLHCPAIHATPGDYPKFCPECGLELKKLETCKD